MSWLVLLVSPAFAVDDDGDTFHVSHAWHPDCNDDLLDGGAAINPGAQEVTGNYVDEDCDGHDALERFYLDFAFTGWSGVGSSVGVDKITLDNTGATASRMMNVPAPRGHVHAVVNASNVVGAGCELEVRFSSSMGVLTDTVSISGSGTTVTELTDASGTSVPGTRMLTRLTLTCPVGASMQVDWISVQNAPDVTFAPSSDIEVSWEDLDLTVGGQHNNVRASASGELLVAAAHGGGVAIWDLTTVGASWDMAIGAGGVALPAHHRYVADVAAVDWDGTIGTHELFALSGRTEGGDTIGGLWRSTNEGASWVPLADSYGAQGTLAPAYDDDSIECFEEMPADGGGKKLFPDEASEVLYVATHREHASHGSLPSSVAKVNGVLLWDQAVPGLCAPDFELPAEEQVSALEMVDGLLDDVPMLLVGYRSPGGADTATASDDVPGLYACAVGTALDGPTLGCPSTTTIECAAVAGTETWDVRDIEVADDGTVYVSTGGADPTSCTLGTGEVYALEIDEFDAIGISPFIEELSTLYAGFVPHSTVPGVALDPSEQFLYATVPGTEEGVLRLDLLNRSAGWSRMGENQAERAAKRANMDVGDGWLGGDELVTELYVPEVRDTERPIDLVWFVGADQADHAALYGWRTIWDVVGLDLSASPATNSEWTLTPFVDNYNHKTWATVGPVDIEADSDGNVWMAVPEQHGFMARSWKDTYPGAGGHVDGREYGTERSCLVDRLGSDGTSVSVGLDDSVWFSLVQSAGVPPHDMGIWRRAPESVYFQNLGVWLSVPRWSFQGAAVGLDWERVDVDTDNRFNDVFCEFSPETYADPTLYPYIEMSTYTGPFATALGTQDDNSGDPNGLVFSDLEPSDTTADSWGNPRAVAALNRLIAVAAFESYNSVEGRLAYTLDGGNSWTEIPYLEDRVGFPQFDATCGDMYDFYDASVSLALLRRGTNSYWDDTDSDGVVDNGEWALDLMVGSSGNTDACMMARVQVAPLPAWDWYSNIPDPDDSVPHCRVTREGFDGLVGTNWSNEIYFWGGYRADQTGLNANGWSEYGGLCVLDLDRDTITHVLSPTPADKQFEYQFSDVAPSPHVADTLLVAGRHTPASVKECMQPIGSTNPMSASFCPQTTPLLLVTRLPLGGWGITPLGDQPGSDAILSVAWGTGEADDMIYVSTESSGAWKGRVWW
ncbi:MAG: hypothetical protein ACK4YP_03045 [Myxococcota bacterium]